MPMLTISSLSRRYLKIVAVTALLLSFIGFPLGWYFNTHEWKPETVTTNQISIDHGCDVLSAYVWCEPAQKCMRLDQEKCEGTVPASASGTLEASGSADASQEP